jgi:hypothetical protein
MKATHDLYFTQVAVPEDLLETALHLVDMEPPVQSTVTRNKYTLALAETCRVSAWQFYLFGGCPSLICWCPGYPSSNGTFVERGHRTRPTVHVAEDHRLLAGATSRPESEKVGQMFRQMWKLR